MLCAHVVNFRVYSGEVLMFLYLKLHEYLLHVAKFNAEMHVNLVSCEQCTMYVP